MNDGVDIISIQDGAGADRNGTNIGPFSHHPQRFQPSSNYQLPPPHTMQIPRYNQMFTSRYQPPLSNLMQGQRNIQMYTTINQSSAPYRMQVPRNNQMFSSSIQPSVPYGAQDYQNNPTSGKQPISLNGMQSSYSNVQNPPVVPPPLPSNSCAPNSFDEPLYYPGYCELCQRPFDRPTQTGPTGYVQSVLTSKQSCPSNETRSLIDTSKQRSIAYCPECNKQIQKCSECTERDKKLKKCFDYYSIGKIREIGDLSEVYENDKNNQKVEKHIRKSDSKICIKRVPIALKQQDKSKKRVWRG